MATNHMLEMSERVVHNLVLRALQDEQTSLADNSAQPEEAENLVAPVGVIDSRAQ